MKTTNTTNRRNGRPNTAAPNIPFAGVKRFAAGLTAALLLLAGCNEDNHDPEAVPSLKISPEKQVIAFSAAATETFTFEVETNQPVWFAQSDQTWCKVEMDAEAGTFTVSATENTSVAAPEPATILVSAGKAGEITLTATQAGADEPTLAIDPAMEAIEFSADASEDFVFTVTTNQSSWTAESDQSWCRVAIDAVAGTFTVTAERNDTAAVPEPATVTVTAGEAAPILIAATQQAGEEPSLTVSTVLNKLAFGFKGKETYVLTVETNQGSWKAASDQPWCRVAADAAAGTLTVTATENSASAPHAPATITVTAGKAAPVEIPVTQNESIYDVYVVGDYETVTDHQRNGCIWKNGMKTLLADSTTYSTAMAVTASDGSLYIAGRADNKYCYWKDGVMVRTLDGPMRSITVENGTVYVFGYSSTYWKDGTLVRYGSPEFLESGLAVSNGTVYVCGQWTDHAIYLPAVYSNGEVRRLDVPVETEWAAARGLAAHQGSIFIGGYYKDKTSQITYPCYWIDGRCETLEMPEGANSASVGRVCVGDDGTIYCLGSYTFLTPRVSGSCYWVNGRRIDLEAPFGSEDYELTGMAVAEGKVHVVGLYFYYADGGRVGRICHWVDGKVTVWDEVERDLVVNGMALMEN